MKYILSVIIPAFNEENTIISLLNKVINVQLENVEKELIIVNDCSTDKTKELLEDYVGKYQKENIKVIHQLRNQGKGAALHKGIEIATGNFIIIQDADYEYDPKEYKYLLKPILEGRADVVYGSRFMGGNPHRILFFWHTIGNKFLTLLSNLFTNLNLTDMETCYKVFRREIIQRLMLKEKRFGFEPEVTAKLSKVKGIRIYEVGISYYGRTYIEGKKINWKDGFKTLWCILKYNMFPTKYLKD